MQSKMELKKKIILL